jgi:NAD(P)-dependent dehydrogenase (short-subunit alcohol dehydrogenase family)
VNELYEIFSVKNKNVLITGAANGNGRALAEAFAKAGSNIFLIDIDDGNLRNLVEEIKSLENTSVQFETLDLGNAQELSNFLELENDFDVVINNAGVTRGNHLFDYEDQDWDLTYRVNLFAPYKIIQEVSKKMSKKGYGSIINITSLAAELGFPDNPAYVAFKGALKQLSKAAAMDLSSSGVRVNSIGPGYFKTNMTVKSWKNKALREERSDRIMLSRWGESSDLIGISIFLASDASSYVTGQDFYIDGGWLAKGL